MDGCCNPRGCERKFTDRFARRTADSYRKRGLSPTEQRIVDAVTEGGVAGATVLEVGGGAGAIQLELLKRGAARVTNLELSPAYEQQAQRLLAEAGLAGRVERRIVDIATHPEQVEPADVVVLHRVVCCYPDYRRLLGAVADHARRQVVFSHPPRNLVSRAFLGAKNLTSRLRRREFRVFAHPPQAMRAVLADHGLRPKITRSGPVWQVVVATR
jgi:2-polyprenyl-3-methyl-5-hydroxy-6-metoxy-1,4-benzoquinol methylase